MSALRIILVAAAVWRITHLLQLEAGPFNLLERLRAQLRKHSFAGAVDCFYCLSLWVAVPFAIWLAGSIQDFVLLALALSTFAILIQQLIAHRENKALYFEEPEVTPAAKLTEETPCHVAETHVLPN